MVRDGSAQRSRTSLLARLPLWVKMIKPNVLRELNHPGCHCVGFDLP